MMFCAFEAAGWTVARPINMLAETKLRGMGVILYRPGGVRTPSPTNNFQTLT